MKFGDIQFVDENVDADGMCRDDRSRGVKNVMRKQAGNLTPMVIITDDKVDCIGRVTATSGCAFRYVHLLPRLLLFELFTLGDLLAELNLELTLPLLT